MNFLYHLFSEKIDILDDVLGIILSYVGKDARIICHQWNDIIIPMLWFNPCSLPKNPRRIRFNRWCDGSVLRANPTCVRVDFGIYANDELLKEFGSRLVEFRCTKSRITSLNDLVNCESIECSRCHLLEDDSIRKISLKLRRFACDGCNFTILPKCEQIHCNNCSRLTDESIRHLGDTLSVLICQGCHFTTLNHLKNCWYIDCSWTPITDSSINELGLNLRRFVCRGTHLTTLDHLWRCTVIDCSGCYAIKTVKLPNVMTFKCEKCVFSDFSGVSSARRIIARRCEHMTPYWFFYLKFLRRLTIDKKTARTMWERILCI